MKRLKILIAEDNDLNRSLMGAIFERYGADFKAVENGKEAMDYFLTESFDAVFLDAQMPVMDGFEAAKAIRAIDASTNTRTPMVVLSGFSMDYLKGDDGEELFDYFMRKPIEASEIQKLLNVIKENLPQ